MKIMMMKSILTCPFNHLIINFKLITKMLGITVNNLATHRQSPQKSISRNLNVSIKNQMQQWLLQPQPKLLQQQRHNNRRSYSNLIQRQSSILNGLIFNSRRRSPILNSSYIDSLSIANLTDKVQKTTNEWFRLFSSGILFDALLRRNSGSSELGFGFSAGGLLFPYLIGVATQLQNEGLITRTTTTIHN